MMVYSVEYGDIGAVEMEKDLRNIESSSTYNKSY